jgi:hypothetical protein
LKSRPINAIAYSRLIPKPFIIKANRPKQMIVATTQAPIVSQNPNFGSSSGNNRNIGNVGITYQKV